MANRNTGSYGHRCKSIDNEDEVFIISWVVDFKYPGSRLRYPRSFNRVTDRAGALKFCKKWNLRLEYTNKAKDKAG